MSKNMIEALRQNCQNIRERLIENSFSMLIWLLDFFPVMGGFPLQTNKISALFMIIHVSLQFYALIVGTVAYLIYEAKGFLESIISFFNVSIFGVVVNNTLWFLFKKKALNELLDLAMINDSLLQCLNFPYWIIHLMLLFYVYFMGNLVYQVKYALVAEDYIKSFVNVSLLTLIVNISWWWLKKRPLLLDTLKLVEKCDIDARGSSSFQKRHTELLRKIKRIIIVFYVCNYTDATLLYLPHRVDIFNGYAMTPCVGLEPLTSSPNKEICLTILFAQECTIMISVLNYQALLLFFIAHTSTMYQLLSEEIMAFSTFSNLEENRALVQEKLPCLIRRHIATLATFDNLKSLYSWPIGIDFASNAICLSLLLYLPLQEWPKFVPVLIYCFLVFFLYCFLCQSLTNASEVFERAVYCCGWENFNQRETKLILVMLMEAQKPVILLAADIIPVNMYTFATTLQAMYKFVTVVKV